MTKKQKRIKIPRYIWLSYLLAVTLVFSGVSYAQYASTAGADASVQTAAFAVAVSVDSTADKAIDNNAGEETTTAQLTVQNDSEVDIRYDLAVNLESALPAGVSITIDGVSAADATGTRLIYTASTWTLAVGAEEKIHTVTITASESRVSENSNVVIESFEVLAEQAEPEG